MRPIIPKQPKLVKLRKAHLPLGHVVDVQAEELERRVARKNENGKDS